MDKYDIAIAFLTANPNQIVTAWYNPGKRTSEPIRQAHCLFQHATKSGDRVRDFLYGCLTQIRSAPGLDAERKDLTRAIRNDDSNSSRNRKNGYSGLARLRGMAAPSRQGVMPATVKKTLAELLDEVSVLASGQWENDQGPEGWFAVCNDNDGIIAYFYDEALALRFRLDYINAILNPVKAT